MPQSIFIKYLPATATKHSRLKAITSSGLSAVIAYPSDVDGDKAFIRAAEALLEKYGLNWGCNWAIGGGDAARHYIAVLIPL